MTCTATRHEATINAYNHYRCRCPGARAAKAREAKRYALHGPVDWSVDATGTHRRIRALNAVGYSLAWQAGWIGESDTYLRKVLDRKTVTHATADKVAQLYNAVSNIPGPSASARRWALKRHDPPPLAWDDDTIDDTNAQPAHQAEPEAEFFDDFIVGVVCEWAGKPLVADERRQVSQLTAAEQLAVMNRLRERGQTWSTIADLLGISSTGAAHTRWKSGMQVAS
jgi:hypothetical protein